MSYDPQASLQDDWQFTEGVVSGGFAYGLDRDTTGLPAAPAAGVRIRPGNPTQNQIAVAASTFGYRVTDKVFTIWSTTLRVDPTDAGTARVIPVENDRLTDDDGVTYIIKWVKETVYDTQYLVYCQRSTLTAE